MSRVKRGKTERIVFGIVFIILFVYTLFILYHFFFALQLATKDNSVEFSLHFSENKLATWSKNLNFGNFKEALFSLEVNVPSGHSRLC